MIKVYCKQPIEAEQFDGSEEMIDRLLGTDYIVPNMGVDDETESDLLFATKGGFLELRVGDWIATGINGENWPIADDIFRKNYAELPVIPDVVAEYISAVKNGETDLEDITAVEAALGAIEYDQASHIEAEWIQQHGDEFARAWLDGYQVEAQHDTRAD